MPKHTQDLGKIKKSKSQSRYHQKKARPNTKLDTAPLSFVMTVSDSFVWEIHWYKRVLNALTDVLLRQLRT